MKQFYSVIFRADGNSNIGLGHIMRCLAFAEMLGTEFKCRFAIHQPSQSVVELLKQRQVTVISLRTQDVQEFLLFVEPHDIVVVDGYSFDKLFQKVVRSVAKILIFIDDLVAGHQVADVIINHTACISVIDYDAEPYTRFLLGPQYALVNPIFRAHTPIPTSQTALINLGGADPMNVSYDIVERVVSDHPNLNIRVVLGAANPHRQSFDSLAGTVNVLRGLSISEMADEIVRCRIAIVSCSTISYEVASVGRPFIGILTAENQKLLAHFHKKQSLAIDVLPLPLDLDYLSSLLTHVDFDEGVAAQRQYLDGLASQRFQTFFHSLLSAS